MSVVVGMITFLQSIKRLKTGLKKMSTWLNFVLEAWYTFEFDTLSWYDINSIVVLNFPNK